MEFERTKFTRFRLFYAQISDTKLFFENNLIAFVDSKRIELTELKKCSWLFKLFISVSLMYRSNIDYCVMDGDVSKVCNSSLQGGLRLQRSKENVPYVLGSEYGHAIISP